jgi:hypothetical protein
MLSDWVTYCDIQFYHTLDLMYILTKHLFKADRNSFIVICQQLLANLHLVWHIQTAMPRTQDVLSKDNMRLLQNGKLHINKFINFHFAYITGSGSFIVTYFPHKLQQLNPLQNLVDVCILLRIYPTNCSS